MNSWLARSLVNERVAELQASARPRRPRPRRHARHYVAGGTGGGVAVVGARWRHRLGQALLEAGLHLLANA
jgi:hypothetical protein